MGLVVVSLCETSQWMTGNAMHSQAELKEQQWGGGDICLRGVVHATILYVGVT